MVDQPVNQEINLKAYAPVFATIYGESANQPVEVKRHVVSSILNRAESGKSEFGADTGNITDVLQKGYYAYSQQSAKYKEAINQTFPDKESENQYKEGIRIFAGVLHGTIPRSDAQFFFTPREAKQLEKSKTFKMNLLENVGNAGAFQFFKYKDNSAQPGRKTNKNSPPAR